MLALGFSAACAPASLAAAAPAQDPGATFGTGETTTTVAVTTTTVVGGSSTTADPANQTLVESEDPPEKAIFTESRKVAAVIGGLVFVALAILLLTIRYIRVTKPVAPGDISDLPFLADDVELDDAEVFVADLAPKAEPVKPVPDEVPSVAMAGASAADHAAADADWEPRTDEHQRVEIPTGTTMARPSIAARRKALGLPAD